MSLPVVLRDEAQAEFDEAFDHYEAQHAGLGVDFAARVEQVFDPIAANPQMHAVVFADIRKAVVASVFSNFKLPIEWRSFQRLAVVGTWVLSCTKLDQTNIGPWWIASPSAVASSVEYGCTTRFVVM